MVIKLPVSNLARDGNCLFQRYRPFILPEIIPNNVELYVKTDTKMYLGKMEHMVLTSR